MLAKSTPSRLAVALFLILFGTYGLTLGPHPVGYADSDELFITAKHLSVAHPSGYPIPTLTLAAASRLMPGVSTAYLGNAIAALLHAAAVTFIFLSALTFFDITLEPNDHVKERLAASFVGALLVGFSSLLWLYAGIYEVISFSSFFAAVLLYSALSWYKNLLRENRSHSRWFYLTFLIAAVNLAHIHTAVLYLPALLVMLIVSRNRLKTHHFYRRISTWMIASVLFISAFICLNMVLLWLNANQAAVSWYFPASVEGLVDFVTRQDYVGQFIEEGKTRPAYFTGLNATYITAQPGYLRFLAQHLSWLGFLALLGGMVAFIKYSSQVKWFIGALVIFTGPLLAGRLGFPDPEATPNTVLNTGVIHRQYVVGELLLGVLIIVGLFHAFIWISKQVDGRARVVLTGAIVFVMIAVQAALNAPVGFTQDNDIIGSYADSLLNTVDDNAVIFCSSDIACFSLLYATTVEGKRPDVTVLTKNPLYRRYFLNRHPEMYPFTFEENPYFHTHQIIWSARSRPTYLTTPSDFYIEHIGLNGDPFFLVPQGYAYRITRDPQSVAPQLIDYQPSQKLLTHPFAPSDYFGRGLAKHFAGIHTTTAMLFANLNKTDEARINYELALSLDPENDANRERLRALETYTGVDRYTQPITLSFDELFIKAREASRSGDLQAAYDSARKASYLEPEDITIRHFIADILVRGKYKREALDQLRQALVFHPEDETLIKRIRELSGVQPILPE